MIDENTNIASDTLYFTEKEPKRTFQTFLRNQNRLYVNAINVIDRKAAIMIRINSTIITGVVFLFQFLNNIKFGNAIGSVLVFCSLFSLLFALLASRPDTFSMLSHYKKRIKNKYTKMEQNIFQLGFNSNVTLDEYENAYNALLKSQELQIGNQVRTMFLYEKKMKNCFLLIDLSFASFILGFVVVVVLFAASQLV